MLIKDSDEINFDQILEFYKYHLHQKILPFWLNHCIDHRNGGINNCVRDDGKLLSTDKYLWSQGRALWVFSHLYNAHGNDLKWLNIAKPIAESCIQGYNGTIFAYGQTGAGKTYTIQGPSILAEDD